MRYKKGEVAFYKESSPKELREYIKIFPDIEQRVDFFLEEYQYNYVKLVWHKKGE
jgi:hypothetical protein